MKVYALKVSNEATETIVNSLSEDGVARYGWSYVYSDLNILKKKRREEMSKEEKNCFKANFLLKIEKGDYIVYINTPSYGKCTVAKIEKEYYWKDLGEDFNHCLGIDKKSIKVFDRNDEQINPTLSRRFKLQGKYWQIYYVDEFKELLKKLEVGELSGKKSSASSRYNKMMEEILPELENITKKIQYNHPEKTLEELIQMILENQPNIQTVERKSGRADKGGDLICVFDTGMNIFGIDKQEKCAIQVKSYSGEMDYKRAIKDIENVFESDDEITCGMIISTADNISKSFEEKFNELVDNSGKRIGLLYGEKLAKWILRYGL